MPIEKTLTSKSSSSDQNESLTSDRTEQATAIAPTPAETPEPSTNRAAVQPSIRMDDSKLYAAYANFCRVTGTPEELIVDFGLNPQPMGVPEGALVISQRIVLNFYTAKRLLGALNMSIQRHEAAFGVLETDVQKRVQPRAIRKATGAT